MNKIVEWHEERFGASRGGFRVPSRSQELGCGPQCSGVGEGCSHTLWFCLKLSSPVCWPLEVLGHITPLWTLAGGPLPAPGAEGAAPGLLGPREWSQEGGGPEESGPGSPPLRLAPSLVSDGPELCPGAGLP